ncbi:DotU family type IV/VI secretion system protein [Gammaproteobacteria bacterium]|nr:DotU family type IV/VI secretion system protein [Gammaproteobacteria bacterium]
MSKWCLLRDEISLNVRGEFLENESGNEPQSGAPEVQEVDSTALSKDFDIQRYIQNRVSDLVEEEIEGAQEILTEREQNNFENMVYGFVALVDELLLVSVRWDQSDEENKRLQRRWLDFLLEKRIFGTRNAGLTLFERISFITQKKALTEMDKQLCAVYLHILGIGFGQNKLSKQLELGFYRRQLLSCISGWSKDLRRPIFDDQPYLVQLSQDSESKRLAPLSKWRRRFLYFLAGYVAVTGISALYLYNWLMTSLGLLR